MFQCKQEIVLYMQAKGVTMAHLADMLGKDPCTVSRQLSPEANIQLETLCEYAMALGGDIKFFPPDWKASTLQDAEDLKGELLRLRTEVSLKDRIIADLIEQREEAHQLIMMLAGAKQ